MDHHRAVGFSASHTEIAMVSAEQSDPNPVAGLHGQTVEAASGVFDLVIMQGAAAQRCKRSNDGRPHGRPC